MTRRVVFAAVLLALLAACDRSASVGKVLAEQDAGVADGIAVATDGASATREWTAFGLAGSPPGVEFESSVLILATGTGSTGCAISFSGVFPDTDRVDVALRRQSGKCKSDAVPRTFVIVVPRKDLPRGNVEFELTVSGAGVAKVQVVP